MRLTEAYIYILIDCVSWRLCFFNRAEYKLSNLADRWLIYIKARSNALWLAWYIYTIREITFTILKTWELKLELSKILAFMLTGDSRR